ncbi:FAD-dependent oxidoreductase, partial [Prosthecobacter sp.]|uniref:FAD-dependent oxidoreductase n=1 Tax=Prosthecobacter sp. TaxID=1965333 RepID=UPI0037833F3E
MKPTARFLLSLALGCAASVSAQDHDIVVYGGTASAIVAAVQAKKMGKSVIVVSPDKHLGGLSS